MTVPAPPYLIVGLAGDSNAGCGDFYDASIDVSDNKVADFLDNGTIQLATEPLNNNLTNGMNPNCVGSTLALCRLLSQRGKIPSGYNILIVDGARAGMAFNAGWAVDSSRVGLDPWEAKLAAALAQNAGNRIWFFDWNHGYNETGLEGNQTPYTAHMISLWAEIRSMYTTAAMAPLLVVGPPPDRSNIVNDEGIGAITAHLDSLNYLDNCAYVDPTDGNVGVHGYPTNGVSMVGAYPATAALVAADGGPKILHSAYPHNNYIHFKANSHRGGLDNSFGSDGTTATNTGETVVYPLSERKYTALMKMGWRSITTFAGGGAQGSLDFSVNSNTSFLALGLP